MFLTPVFRRPRKVSRPFGFIMSNGLNFARSIHNPNSVLRRILATVSVSPHGLTKREILSKIGVELDVPKTSKCHENYVYDSKTKVWNGVGSEVTRTYTVHVARGYFSYYFRGLHLAGFLVPRRTSGNTVVWERGPNFPNLEKIINL